jgi:hypothetical protein
MYSKVLRHWWNGTYGRLSRRDIYVRTDGQTFQLELREGGSEGRSARAVFDELWQAEEEAALHRDPAMTWRDISGAHDR